MTTGSSESSAHDQAAALERELRRHRTALQVLGIGTWTRDAQTGAVEWSRESAELFGIAWSDAPQTVDEFFALVHPEDRARFAAVAAEALSEKRDYQLTFRYLHSSGECGWMQGRGRGIYDPNGALLELAGIGMDVTGEQRAREIADDHASLLRQIGDNLEDGALYQVVAELDGSRRFTYWSAGIERLIGVSPQEALANAGTF
ncbi:MAG: PAS domain-containing protein, partial [Verrucomicrobiota bacterium]|nr:PAS domain-containing protein [Verrucomicrobiota bacterium]